jgi:hypothetical protein
MGFLDSLKKALGSKSTVSSGGGRSGFGDEAWTYWVHAQCRRCGEPLRARIDLRNDPSQEDDGTWRVRKGLTGGGKFYCFQTVEVVLHFDKAKKTVLDGEVTGGKLITAEEYPVLLAEWQQEQARLAAERAGEEQNKS